MSRRELPSIEIIERLHMAHVLGMASEIAHEHQLPFSAFLAGRLTAPARAQFFRIVMTLKQYSASEVGQLFGMHHTAVTNLLHSDEIKQLRNIRRLSRIAQGGRP